jgi:hypothetical protein
MLTGGQFYHIRERKNMPNEIYSHGSRKYNFFPGSLSGRWQDTFTLENEVAIL